MGYKELNGDDVPLQTVYAALFSDRLVSWFQADQSTNPPISILGVLQVSRFQPYFVNIFRIKYTDPFPNLSLTQSAICLMVKSYPHRFASFLIYFSITSSCAPFICTFVTVAGRSCPRGVLSRDGHISDPEWGLAFFAFSCCCKLFNKDSPILTKSSDTFHFSSSKVEDWKGYEGEGREGMGKTMGPGSLSLSLSFGAEFFRTEFFRT